MKRAIAVFLSFYALGLLAFPAAAQTIKLGTLAPEGSPWYDAIRDMAEAWKEA